MKRPSTFDTFPQIFGRVIVFLFLLGGLILPLAEKTRDNIFYLSILVCIPILVAALIDISGTQTGRAQVFWNGMMVLLACFMGTPIAKLGAALFCLVQLVASRPPELSQGTWKERLSVFMRAETLQLWAVWVISGEIVFDAGNRFGGKILESWFSLGIITAGIYAWTWVNRQVAQGAAFMPSKWDRLWLLAPFVLGFPHLWTLPGGAPVSHHWDFYIGPMLLLREGGALLHSVPSQYGYLSILALRWVDSLVGDPYPAFFLVLVIFYFAEAWLIAEMVRFCLGVNRFGVALVGALSLAATWFNPSWQTGGDPGAVSYPSAGAYRFIWVVMMLAWVLRMTVRQSRGGLSRGSYLGGTLLWVVACLWSVEAAVYSTLVWLPAFFLFLWAENRLCLRTAVGPLIVAGLVASAVLTTYRLSWGFWPDIRGYFEYALLYAGGFFGIPADRNGPVWIPILLWVLLTLIGVRLYREKKFNFLPLAVATLMGVWSTSSYFAARSHAINLVNLIPIYTLGWAIAIYLVRTHWKKEYLQVSRYAVPFFAVVTLVTLGDARFWGVYAQELRALGLPRDNASLMAVRHLDPEEAVAILRDNGVVAKDRVVSLQNWLPAIGSTFTRPWLPVAPYPEYVLLSEARRRAYLDAWDAQGLAKGGGYLLYPLGFFSTLPELERYLAKFRRTLHAVSRGWALDHFE